ncbi:hypothetical protein [Stutzerimonas nitrititolerans]|uniref:hypothetical protein n=1 Tax=Stutzerimonas nitrititolerans TaxID=2482751 RepID=UPI0028A12F3E|nr:hypothetical protein [Stutzerimonas nitrititolerans]
MATAYHRDQPGAPALTYSAAAASVAQFQILKEILKACLIDGYGEAPAAGWELVNEGTNFIVLRNGSRSGYVCLTCTGQLFRIYLSATYTGMNGNVMAGDGLKSGVTANNGTPQALGNYCIAYSPASSSWAVVADEKTFVLSQTSALSPTPTSLATTATLAYVGATLYVGEDTQGHFISVGGQNTASNTYSAALGKFSGLGFTSLVDPSTGLLVDSGGLSVHTPQFRDDNSYLALNSVVYPLAGATLAKAFWVGGEVYAGELRGVAVVSELPNTTNTSHAARSLGYPEVMNTRTGSTPLDLGDEHFYFCRMGQLNACPFFLLTDNPEFW